MVVHVQIETKYKKSVNFPEKYDLHTFPDTPHQFQKRVHLI